MASCKGDDVKHIDIPMKKSDILDRWTILLMKSRFDKDAQKELGEIYAVAKGLVDDIFQNGGTGYVVAIMQLMEANAKIWVLEASIRREYEDGLTKDDKDLPLDEVGRRCLEIRDHNKLRIEAKKLIETYFGGIPDNKVNHAST